MFAGKVAQKFEVARLGEDKACVGSVGFEDDRRDLLPALDEDLLHALGEIKWEGDCFRGEGPGYSRGIRFAMSEST